ncbi:unnamed protein product, partial [Musa banksii]
KKKPSYSFPTAVSSPLCLLCFCFASSFLLRKEVTAMDKGGYVVLDIDNLTQPPEKCYTGSPKMTKALSRKGSNRMEKRTSDEQEADDETKRLVAKAAPSQLEQLKQSLLTNKSLTTAQSAANAPMLLDSGEGHKRLNRLSVIHPHRVLLVFATMSCLGTTILIYFTLAIRQRNGSQLGL